MLALANVFRRHLKDYANKILTTNLPKSASAGSAIVGSSSTASLSSMTNTLTKDLKDFSTQGFIQNVQSFLKEGEAIRLTADERVFVCSAIVTAEYIIGETELFESNLSQEMLANFDVDFCQHNTIYSLYSFHFKVNPFVIKNQWTHTP